MGAPTRDGILFRGDRQKGTINFKFKVDKMWPHRSVIDRFCARWTARMIFRAEGETYQMGGWPGMRTDFKQPPSILVNVPKFTLMQWILREAGYSCCIADIKKRCGVPLLTQRPDGAEE